MLRIVHVLIRNFSSLPTLLADQSRSVGLTLRLAMDRVSLDIRTSVLEHVRSGHRWTDVSSGRNEATLFMDMSFPIDNWLTSGRDFWHVSRRDPESIVEAGLLSGRCSYAHSH